MGSLKGINICEVNGSARKPAGLSLWISGYLLLATGVIALPGQALAGGAWCSAPFVQVAGQGVGVEETGELEIQSVSIGEPFTNCSARSLTVVIKVNTLDPGQTGQVTPPYDTEWEVEFQVPHNLLTPDPGSDQIIFVSWDTETIPTGQFNYGFFDENVTMIGPIQSGARYTPQCSLVPGACPVTGTVTPDGTITINLDMTSPLTFKDINGTLRFTMAAIPPGWQLTSIAGNTWICACAAGNGTPINVSQTPAFQSYTIQGNASCSNPPIAALAASPTSGSAPLTVNFDASGSRIPADGCGTIKNYIFTFGDGTQVTQSTPTVAHTYSTAAVYPARVRVTNTFGVVSTNNAEADVTVSSAAPPALASVVSRMTHGAVGDFDIVLPQPPAARKVECRGGGPNSNYKLVFTFVNALAGVGSATVTNGDGTVAMSALGPNANQYTVNLTGVTNAQSTTVTLHNAIDSIGASGDVSGVIGILVGDTNGDGFVNSADIGQTKSQSGAAVTNSNFREDVNADGFLNSADIGLVKSESGTALP